MNTHQFNDGQDYPGGAEAAVLPKHIGGYQHMERNVTTRFDDILVRDGNPDSFVGGNVGRTVGEIEDELLMNVYRKYPCPRQGGDRALTRDEVAAQRRVADHQMSEERAPSALDVAEKRLAEEARAPGRNALPSDPKSRKAVPIYSGFVKYFPRAIAAIAHLSQVGNDQHNPGKPLHWDRSKSGDELDALMRHLMEADRVDSDGVPHIVKCAWRACAAAEKYLEKNS